MPLWFGSGIHWALSQYYDPVLPRDPVEVFQTWWEVQWRGGIITEDWLDQVYDRKPVAIDTQPEESQPHIMYRVQGLKDLIDDPDVEPFEEHRELGINMLKYYKDYAEEFDNFSVIMAEHTFSVPVHDPDGLPLYKTDPRDGGIRPVHIRGTQDAIIQDNESGRFGILEHKSAIRIDEDYFTKLDKDEQCTTYMYAAEQEAKIHSLEYDRIDFVIYNAIRKAFPRPPTEVRGGVFSIDRNKESTTPEMLQKFIDENGIQVIVDEDEKLKAYVEYVNTVGHEQFIIRNMVRRNRAEIRSCGSRIYMEAMDMLSDPRIYPNPTGDYMCLRCPFRAPCIAKDDGSDYIMMLDDMFEINWSR
jgi:hypothetical protein